MRIYLKAQMGAAACSAPRPTAILSFQPTQPAMPDARTPDTPIAARRLLLCLAAFTLLCLVGLAAGAWAKMILVVGTLAAIFLVLFGLNMLISHQVVIQTRSLTATNRHLKEELWKQHTTIQELKKYARVVEASNNAIALFDRDHNHLLVNNAYLSTFGFSRDDLQRTSLPEVVGREFYGLYLQEAVTRCLQGEQVNVTAVFAPPGGSPEHWHIHLGPYVISENYVLGYAIDIRDITPLIALENQLKHPAVEPRTQTRPGWSAISSSIRSGSGAL